MKLMRSLKLPAALLVIFLSVQAAYSQYTLVKDTVVFTHFPDSFRIAPSGKAPEYGISVNQFGIPTGEFYGTGYKLTNFKLFGHLVDSMFINHHIHKVHFLLANGKKEDLSFRTGNAVFLEVIYGPTTKVICRTPWKFECKSVEAKDLDLTHGNT